MSLTEKLSTLGLTHLENPLSVDDIFEIVNKPEFSKKYDIKKEVLDKEFSIYGIVFYNIEYPSMKEAEIRFHPLYKKSNDKYYYVDIYSFSLFFNTSNIVKEIKEKSKEH